MVNTNAKHQKAMLLLGVSSLILWGVLTFEGLSSAVAIWWGNEIFNHCFLILPVCIYLINTKRTQLSQTPFKPTLFPLPLIAVLAFCYIVGVVGKINLVQHLATFTLLPLIVWSLIGHQAARVIWFPLVFVIFSVPVGEQLIPSLQSITADGAAALLEFSGIPLFRNGLYLEIPSGRFVVAEACSGVSFFIASIVIGLMYTYLFIEGRKRQALFILIAFVLPVLANIVRVYGIISIAHYSNMQYAVGADHLIYGWVFFSFVIVCLFIIGEKIRDKQLSPDRETPLVAPPCEYRPGPVVLLLCILVGANLWQVSISLGSTKPLDSGLPALAKPLSNQCSAGLTWQPPANNATEFSVVDVPWQDKCAVRLYRAWFNEVDESELVSAQNRLYHPTDWTLLDERTETIQLAGSVVKLTVLQITNSAGDTIYLTRWYRIGNNTFVSAFKAKLYQLQLALVGESPAGEWVVLAWHDDVPLREVLDSYSLLAE